MSPVYNPDLFYGHLIQGNLTEAMAYLSCFPERSARYERYLSVFEQGRLIDYDIDSALSDILRLYQQYYRDVFYLKADAAQAEEELLRRLADYLGVASCPEDSIEDKAAECFLSCGFHFLGGKTSGYRGPYVWKSTETKTYEVELPEGAGEYTIRLLDGFICRSWIDYISFGEVSPGGWTDGDGIICCAKDSYDLQSEAFRVSLLKHEAQHVMDLNAYPSISSADLEYRAKLVELIYSEKRNLLLPFIHEADQSNEHNGHAFASGRICAGFREALKDPSAPLESLSLEDIRSVSKELFFKSSEEMRAKYL